MTDVYEEAFMKGEIEQVEVQPVKAARAVLNLPVKNENNYFATVKKEGVEMFSSGCQLLDCVLGGGWVLGRMSNIVGDKSSGKCAYSGMIATEQGFEMLETLGQNFEDGATEWEQTLKISKGNEDVATHFYKEQNTEFVKIKTKKGYEIEVTPNHPVLVWTKDCETVMKRAGSIEETDIMVIAKNNQHFGFNEITPDLAVILGALVADGINPKFDRIDISTTRPYLKEKLTKACENLGLSFRDREKNFIIGNKPFAQYVHSLIDFKEEFTARNKFIPDCILKANKPAQVAFLQTLIDCDGWSDKKLQIEYYTASETLAYQVQLLLLNLGIVSTRSYKDSAKIGEKVYEHKYWKIAVYGWYYNLYIDEINSQKNNLEKCKASPRSDYDLIPFLTEKMFKDRERLKTLVGWSTNGSTKIGKRFPRFSKFSQKVEHSTWDFIEQFVEVHQEFEGSYKDFTQDETFDLSFYRDLLKSDFCFDLIDTLEKGTTSEPRWTYDVHVPKSHLFWCNGFVSHNTLLAIEACSNFIRQYPNGKIYYMEAEAAFDIGYAEAIGMPIDSIEFVDCGDDNTVEFLHDYLTALTQESKIPTLFVVDSLDALSDRAEKEREIDKGTFAMGKQKKMSEMFRRLIKPLESSSIHLMIISQVRENIGVTFGSKYTRSGGKAMDFYATHILWLAEAGKLKKTIKGMERIIGIKVKANCKKNKIGLPFRTCDYPVYFGYGIDDIEASLEFLITCKELSSVSAKLGIGVEDVDKLTPAMTKSIKKLMETREGIDKLRKVLDAAIITAWQDIEQSFLPKMRKY